MALLSKVADLDVLGRLLLADEEVEAMLLSPL